MKDTKPFYRILSAKIRLVRELREITQQEMADKIGMSKANYNFIESGHNQIYVHQLMNIATILDVKVQRLFENNL